MIIVGWMPQSFAAGRFPLLRYSHGRGFMAINTVRIAGTDISLYPFIEDVKTPGARPRGAAREKIFPNCLREISGELRFKSRRPFREPRRDALAQRSAKPVFPRKSKRALSLRDDFLG